MVVRDVDIYRYSHMYKNDKSMIKVSILNVPLALYSIGLQRLGIKKS